MFPLTVKLEKIRLTFFRLNRENKMASQSRGFGRGGDGNRRDNSGRKKMALADRKDWKEWFKCHKEFIYRTPFFIFE